MTQESRQSRVGASIIPEEFTRATPNLNLLEDSAASLRRQSRANVQARLAVTTVSNAPFRNRVAPPQNEAVPQQQRQRLGHLQRPQQLYS